MKVQEWQDKFLSLIYDSGLNIFPPAMIKIIKNASDEDAAEWYLASLQYTQALRDVPQQAGFPESVEWPQCP